MNRRRPSVPHHRGRLPLHSARPLFSPRPSLPSAVSFLRSAPGSHSASPLHGSRANSPLRGMGRSPSPSPPPPPPHSQRVSLAPQQPAFGLQRRRSIRDALEAIETGQLVPQSRKQSLLAANSPSGLIPGMNNPLILGGFGRSGSTVKFAFDADQNGRGDDQLNQRGVAVIGSGKFTLRHSGLKLRANGQNNATSEVKTERNLTLNFNTFRELFGEANHSLGMENGGHWSDSDNGSSTTQRPLKDVETEGQEGGLDEQIERLEQEENHLEMDKEKHNEEEEEESHLEMDKEKHNEEEEEESHLEMDKEKHNEEEENEKEGDLHVVAESLKVHPIEESFLAGESFEFSSEEEEGAKEVEEQIVVDEEESEEEEKPKKKKKKQSQHHNGKKDERNQRHRRGRDGSSAFFLPPFFLQRLFSGGNFGGSLPIFPIIINNNVHGNSEPEEDGDELFRHGSASRFRKRGQHQNGDGSVGGSGMSPFGMFGQAAAPFLPPGFMHPLGPSMGAEHHGGSSPFGPHQQSQNTGGPPQRQQPFAFGVSPGEQMPPLQHHTFGGPPSFLDASRGGSSQYELQGNAFQSTQSEHSGKKVLMYRIRSDKVKRKDKKGIHLPKVNRQNNRLYNSANIHNEFGICGWILTVLSYILIFLTLPISACMSIKVVQEYERAVIFRLGRLLPGGAKGPGIFFIVPCIDTYRKVDLRVLSFEVPPQEILSKDSVTVAVDAVVYFRISNATISVTNVEDASRSTKLLAQTTLRNILGTKTLAEMLSDREAISLQMQATLDEATEPWGVKLQRAMAAEAEAAREARAKVIVAEGEQKASRALKEAADVIAESPQAIQLRYLQTLNSISAEKNSTIIFPFPIDLLSSLLHPQQLQQRPQPPALAQPLQQYAHPQPSASIAQQQNCSGSFSGPFSSTTVVDTQFKHQKARQL
uniref:Band 7 domain-containing protein n=1 Tax=Globodera rostochiensis TaxID=31243 RepID=A0A914IDU6_GLORO